MEVFLHRVPADLNRHGFKRELQPFMKNLQIQDFICEKPRKKWFGTVTFLHVGDGERFLQAYGEKQNLLSPLHRAPKSSLNLMGVDVCCKPSRFPPKPFALRTLEHEAQERAMGYRERQEESVVLELQQYSCGRCDFVGDQLTYSPEVQWSARGTVKFKTRSLIVNVIPKCRIRIPLATIVSLIYSIEGTLTVTLSDVPFFFEVIETFDEPVGLPSNRIRLSSLGNGHDQIVGQCLVYQFKVSAVDFRAKIEKLKDWDVTIYRYNLAPAGSLLSSQSASVDFRKLLTELAECTRNRYMPFGVLFQLQALAQNAYLHPTTTRRLTERLRMKFDEDKAAGRDSMTVEGIRKLFNMIGWPFPGDDPWGYAVDSLLTTLEENNREIQDGFAYREGLHENTANMTKVHRVNVTPTRITLHGPEMEPQNRILRKFPNHHEYFIRVQFCDENGEDLLFNAKVDFKDIFARFKDIMTKGIQIAGRTYNFLGFSHSSLRSHTVWFSSPFVDDNGHMQTYFSIISAIGKFSHITSPARCAARIGQAFTETPFMVPLEKHRVRVSTIPDLTSPDDSRVFSDGVGAISKEVVASIWADIPLKRGNPTCFQIRLGGAKGMLAADTRLPSAVIQIRPSMIKFDSEDMQNLEICNMASRPYPMVLNRQVIKILEDMGAPQDWFFQMQNEELTRLQSITVSTDKTARFLKDKGVGECIGLYRLYRQCYWTRLNYKNDGFLRAIVEAVVLRELRLLKHKARIPVEKGMTLYGVIDETAFLQEGEVYVTFDRMEGQYAAPPGPGHVLVTRSPALHCGDIQRAQNVLPPEDHHLRYHRNCIVFSQKGSRDLPSKLSGGDLDGDLYHVIWDPDLESVETFAPADYPRPTSIDIGRVVEVGDMAAFFVEFMRSDILGMIAIRHMIMADQAESGTRDASCRVLAGLHSKAVDFSKTGIPVNMMDMPRVNRYRPDFLAPGPQTRLYNKSKIGLEQHVSHANYDDNDDDVEEPYRYYKSEKILGKLFRAIDEQNIWRKHILSEAATNDEYFWNSVIADCLTRCKSLSRTPKEEHLDEAKRIRAAYEDAIVSTMDTYSDHPTKPISELEVVIGSIINRRGVQTRRQRDRSDKLHEEFDRIATWATNIMRRQEVQDPDPNGLELSMACLYHGTHVSDSGRRKEVYGELKSFRVVAVCALLAELDYRDKDGPRNCFTM
ncbi:RNA dependent RNA polymerase-domain-containing protein [Aspergillus pseudonomiae]|uniref:RNA-dependent RNA polymerase n=1 Tax=Aspergillus pseudonomiae TaxID=1506151 RepID=A0A5N7DQK7_9EURO|nr:RNA dependent RNA polymerase-domain-containing protein [Aspergillus pseudonomiae]KAE8408721.1 RNA dependent RNA polymerase-domain-containing protein [Aspergillus pseudonomiae]